MTIGVTSGVTIGVTSGVTIGVTSGVTIGVTSDVGSAGDSTFCSVSPLTGSGAGSK